MTDQYRADLFKQIDSIFKEAENIRKDVEKMSWEVRRQSAQPISYPWKKWFAWRPVTVKGKTKWMRNVYRREIPKTYADYDDWTRYEYGDIFDVLKDAGK